MKLIYTQEEMDEKNERIAELEEADRQWDKTSLVQIITQRDDAHAAMKILANRIAQLEAALECAGKDLRGDLLEPL
jgi:DNA mismatch repair ATPase MutS